MHTVVLAAGQGTRMRPLTDRRPKPMLPVAGRPLLAHTLEAAIAAGASHLHLVVGYEAEAVRSHFGTDYSGVPITYAEQAEQRGTADAVLVARGAIPEEPFAVLNGDALYDHASLAHLYDVGPSVAAHEVSNPSNYGVLETDGDRVTGVVEKPETPPSNLVNAGAYVFPAAARDWLAVAASERGERELTDVLERVCGEFPVTAVQMERWLDVGRPWELLTANEWCLADLETRIEGSVHDRATVDETGGPIVIGADATVREGVTIEGPAYVGNDVTIGPNAYVRGATALGPGSHVGHSVEVKNSVLMDRATAGHLTYIGDSVIGRDVNLGAGTTVANLRHDDAEITMSVKDERVSTGRRKFGVVLGDGVKTGIDTSLNAGVVLNTETTTLPGETILE